MTVVGLPYSNNGDVTVRNSPVDELPLLTAASRTDHTANLGKPTDTAAVAVHDLSQRRRVQSCQDVCRDAELNQIELNYRPYNFLVQARA